MLPAVSVLPQATAVFRREPGIHVITLCTGRKDWRLQGEVVPAREKAPEGCGAADKFTVVLETAGMNDPEHGAYCRERVWFPNR